jgi:hypothetical protein
VARVACGKRASGIRTEAPRWDRAADEIRSGKTVITDGPYTEAREIIGGFFAFAADTYEQAVELAADCPHLEFGTIEIREVERIAAG